MKTSRLSCSTSLTSKGLRHLAVTVWVTSNSLQHLPDFKGIETLCPNLNQRLPTCSTSLTSKGLRRLNNWRMIKRQPCSTSLTSKGLRPMLVMFLIKRGTCSTSLTSKGLRPLEHSYISICLFLQHLPDFKGIETFIPDLGNPGLSCSTSLTSKGLRRLMRLYSRPARSCSTSLTSKGLRLRIEMSFSLISLAAPP